MYVYADIKPTIFTEAGQVNFLKIRDHAKDLLAKSGAVTMGKLLNAGTGDTWERMACVDRLVELNELYEIPQGGVAGQHRIFILKGS